MLYDKKPSMSGLYEWGNKVWIHTPGGSKLDGCTKIGRWIGYNETSNGHRIYWPNKCSVTVEQSIRIVYDDVILSSNPIAKPIQGENGPENPQHHPETKFGPKIIKIIVIILKQTKNITSKISKIILMVPAAKIKQKKKMKVKITNRKSHKT